VSPVNAARTYPPLGSVVVVVNCPSVPVVPVATTTNWPSPGGWISICTGSLGTGVLAVPSTSVPVKVTGCWYATVVTELANSSMDVGCAADAVAGMANATTIALDVATVARVRNIRGLRAHKKREFKYRAVGGTE
jgi:hypothetical protein